MTDVRDKKSGLERRVCNAVQRERKRKQMTGADLADSCGLALNTIRSIESGARGPSMATLERVAEALSVPPALFLIPDVDGRPDVHAAAMTYLFVASDDVWGPMVKAYLSLPEEVDLDAEPMTKRNQRTAEKLAAQLVELAGSEALGFVVEALAAD